ncbi:MerR family transcriptional regulator [Saccharothrix coeruleofusca]|uniref:MerR family transcriptional regulator n=1 Tax=Saccharothrix coeruleofusca TaxID=33919 RepID=A0A918AQI7_9PSEU|nr:MerR family transcriptional regulator [Saccharothrix coeruleofusca]MBP2334594.1 DNA-binding transcriptional MerR regulator [Saccharothrix coeruleofusca]GGP73331.1 MerR family transcriptional regulator [Saccharothrix coeruleofusca]
MRIAELSRRSGVPVPTIKYYLREGLLPAGELTSPNQARYGEGHVRRLRLVRAMVEVGGLSIAAVREVLGALDDPEGSMHKALGTVEAAVTPEFPVQSREDEVAREQATEFVARRGYSCAPDSPAFQALVGVLTTAREVGHDRFADLLDDYADACDRVAERDLDYVFTLGAGTREEVLEGVAVGTVLGDTALALVRRMARQAVSERRTGQSGDDGAR